MNYSMYIQWNNFAAIKNDIVELYSLTLKDADN